MVLWYHMASHASATPPTHLHGLEEIPSRKRQPSKAWEAEGSTCNLLKRLLLFWTDVDRA